jgi:hypothetical protein
MVCPWIYVYTVYTVYPCFRGKISMIYQCKNLVWQVAEYLEEDLVRQNLDPLLPHPQLFSCVVINDITDQPTTYQMGRG